MGIEMKILDIFKREKKEKNIIKRDVNILSVKDGRQIDLSFTFEFDFVKEDGSRKKAIVSINNEKVTLDEGQSCIFIMKSGDLNPIRFKAQPDFKKEGCHTTMCHDPKIKDEDI